MEWTDAAKKELDRHMEGARSGLEGTGADPSEVVEDLRRHVQEEALSSKLSIVTDQDVRRILARLGPVTTEPAAAAVPLSKVSRTAALVGAAVGAIALAVECFTHMCSGLFVDPIPTAGHIALIAMVPAGLGGCWLMEGRRRPTDGSLQFIASFCLGISLYYSLMFAPIFPFAVIGLMYMGLGILPMAPMLSAVGAFVTYRALAARTPDRGLKRLAAGLGVALVIFVGIEAPQTLTRTGLSWSASDDAAKARRGTSLLRRLGNEEILRRACYQRAGRVSDLFTMFFAGPPVSPDKARLVYYRVYGAAFNSAPPPKQMGRRWMDDDSFWDPEQGGEAVGNRIPDLALSASRLDGSVDAAAALGYLEWTMVFRNDSHLQQEARALISLPPGGAVSRVTLWIDGEEREAAFGGRGQVKRAYEAVVRQRRDPVLVTTRGSDRAMVQLFPVPPGGEMKVRLGITAPVAPLSPERWALQLPSIGERNFGVKDLRHSVWIESKRPLAAPTLKPEGAPGGATALRGAVSDDDLSSGYSILLTESPSPSAGGSNPLGGSVRQTITSRVEKIPVMLVVDGSAPMAAGIKSIAQVLREAPVDSAFVAANDELLEWTGAEAASKLAALKALGGQDNVPALLRAWDAAAAKNGIVVWIHGSLPVALTSSEGLRQRWERRPEGPRILELVAGGRANAVLGELDGLSRITQVPRAGKIDEDFRLLLDRFGGRRPAVEILRESGAGPGTRTSAHLARLWALDEVRRLLASGTAESRAKAADLSVRHRLVTPVSGAVVLESAEQYKNAGLEAPDSTKGPAVPVVPEPETWALLLVSGAAFLWWLRKRPMLA